ncbi:hypothetical protein CP8484711_1140B, partial [Chlamydia psittaci 84-8471/1]
ANTMTPIIRETRLFDIAVRAPLLTTPVFFEANPEYTRSNPQPAPVSQAFWVRASNHNL